MIIIGRRFFIDLGQQSDFIGRHIFRQNYFLAVDRLGRLINPGKYTIFI